MTIVIKTISVMIIFIFTGAPAATVTANSTFYDQIFEATNSLDFETAVENFFEESLNTIKVTPSGLAVYPKIDPTEAIEIRNLWYLETEVTTVKEIGVIEVFFQLGSGREAVFNVKLLQNAKELVNTDVNVSISGWKAITLANQLLPGTVTIRITGKDVVSGDGVKTLTQDQYNTTGGKINHTATYFSSHEELQTTTQYYLDYVCDEFGGNCRKEPKAITTTTPVTVWEAQPSTMLPAIKLQTVDVTGWKYQLVDEGTEYYRIEKMTLIQNIKTIEIKGYVSYPSLLTFYPHKDGGPNYDLPTNFQGFLSGIINQENNYYPGYDQEEFYDALVRIASDPEQAAFADWLMMEERSEEVFQRLITPPYSYLITKELLNGQYQPVLQKRQLINTYYGCLEWDWRNDICKQDYYNEEYDYTTIARISTASIYSASPEDLILLAVNPEGERPSTPYFWDWMVERYEEQGYTVSQTIKDQLAESHQLSPVTTTNISLLLDPEAPEGVSPYVAEITVSDKNGNMVLGNLSVEIEYNHSILVTGKINNGTGIITLPKYVDRVTAFVIGNEFFHPSQGVGEVKYDLTSIIRNQGPEGTDPIENTKFTIFRSYILESGAFSKTEEEIYTMDDDLSHSWIDDPFPGIYPAVIRGYEIVSAVHFTDKELREGTFNDDIITVKRFWGENFPVEQRITTYLLNKYEFLTMWLSMKLRPWTIGGNPPEPEELLNINELATDTHDLFLKDYSWFQSNELQAQKKVEEIGALTMNAIGIGFPKPQGYIVETAVFIAALIILFIISPIAFILAVVAALAVIYFLTMLWDGTFEKSLGIMSEVVKNYATRMIADVQSKVLLVSLPTVSSISALNSMGLGRMLLDTMEISISNFLKISINSMKNVIPMTTIIDSLTLILMNVVNHVLQDTTATLVAKVEGNYGVYVYPNIGYTWRKSMFTTVYFEVTERSMANVLTYMSKKLTFEIHRFFSELLPLTGKEKEIIGEMMTIHYLTKVVGLNILDIFLFDTLFRRTFNIGSLYTAPDFLINGMTYFEAKATGVEAINYSLKSAYKDLYHGIFLNDQIAWFVNSLNKNGGISCYDTFEKQLIVQWVQILKL